MAIIKIAITSGLPRFVFSLEPLEVITFYYAFSPPCKYSGESYSLRYELGISVSLSCESSVDSAPKLAVEVRPSGLPRERVYVPRIPSAINYTHVVYCG